MSIHSIQVNPGEDRTTHL